MEVEAPHGGVTALSLEHISDLDEDFDEDVSSVVSAGQKVKVYVKEVNMAADVR